MRRRPICAAAAAVTLLLVILWGAGLFRPESPSLPDGVRTWIQEEEEVLLTGRVSGREKKANSVQYTLKDVSVRPADGRQREAKGSGTYGGGRAVKRRAADENNSGGVLQTSEPGDTKENTQQTNRAGTGKTLYLSGQDANGNISKTNRAGTGKILYLSEQDGNGSVPKMDQAGAGKALYLSKRDENGNISKTNRTETGKTLYLSGPDVSGSVPKTDRDRSEKALHISNPDNFKDPDNSNQKSQTLYLRGEKRRNSGKDGDGAGAEEEQEQEQEQEQKQEQEQEPELKTGVLVTTQQEETLQIGARVRIEGVLEYPETPGNPGQFDSALYYAAKKIGCTLWAERIEIIEDVGGPGEWALRARKHAADVLRNMMPEEIAGVMTAMLLGDKSGLAEDIKLDFQYGGVLHLLCISGLHLSLLGMGLYRGLIWLRLPQRAAAVLAVLLMMGYAQFTGGNPATVRALIMFAVLLLAKTTGRSYDCASALALALLLLVIQNPVYLFYSGFQLSFAAAAGAGIVWPLCRPVWKKHKRTRTAQVCRKAAENMMACTVITASTLPLVCWYFYEIPVYSLIVNFVMLPAAAWILIPGAAGLAAGTLWLPAGRALCMPAWLLLLAYEKLLGLVRELPCPSWICGRPCAAQAAGYYALLFLGLGGLHLSRSSRKKAGKADRSKGRGGGPSKSGSRLGGGQRKSAGKAALKRLWPLCFAAACLVLFFRAEPELSVTILDVGQGDGIAVRAEGHTWLIDGGSTTEKHVGKYRLLPYLKSQGIKKLDGIILTHPDEDHINGAEELLEMCAERDTALRVERVFLPAWMEGGEEAGRFARLAARAGAALGYLRQGDRITAGEAELEVLHPDGKDYSETPNEGSVVLAVRCKRFRVLLTGDLEKEAEEGLKLNGETFTVLKVGHHGSKFASGEALLEQAQPSAAVISFGKGNRYGHPHAETLERLEESGAEIYETPECGAVCFETDGERLRVKLWKKRRAF